MQKIGMMWKQFLSYFLIIILSFMIFLLLTTIEIKKHHINMLKSDLEHQAELVKEMVKDFIILNEYKEIDSIVKDIGKRLKIRITIIRKDGSVIADTEEDPNKMDNHASRPEIVQASHNKTGSKIRYSSTLKREMLYLAIPIVENKEIIGFVRTSFYIDGIKKDLWEVNRKILYSAMVLTVLALLYSMYSSRTLTKQIREISSAGENIKNGDFATRIIVKRKDEIGSLANSINEMARELQNLFDRLSTEREELKTILSSMNEGLVVLDDKGKIILSNRSFARILGLSSSQSIDGKHYRVIWQNLDFDKLIKLIIQSKKSQSKEIQFDDKIYLVNGSFSEDTSELSESYEKRIIIILHDITEIRQLEKIKADFIANVTHELKTPLTSIKGFVETLEQEIGYRHRHFLEIIKRNTNRLINIVSDLLLLSELEYKELKLEVRELNLRGMVNNIIKIFEEQLKDKNINVEIDIQDDFPLLRTDPFWIDQIFINLIDNAIKYTEKGSIKVKVCFLNKKMSIEISDTGIGIPKEHLSRIFERFYVVNKSRSRKLGGTGLGLSIVKHIVLAHSGKIDVESTPGKGTKFTVLLPIEDQS